MKKRSSGLPPIGPGDVHLAAHLFQGARLTLARELRGLTRVELAARVSKTPSAIGQFEVGRSRPDAKTLAALSLALGIPLGFFARPSPSMLGMQSCHLRTLRSASQRERKKLLSLGTLLCELVAELDQYVEFPEERVTEAAQSPTDFDDIERCANAVRKAWGLGQGPLPNVVKLLQSKGIIVCLVPPTCREVDAFSTWHDARPLVFLVADKNGSRMRFDAGHELGHLVMHPDAEPGSPEVEREANRFAGAFLIPREAFLAEWPGWLNWDHILEMKLRWKVSLAAIIPRAHDLGVLTDASYRRANIFLRRHGRDEPGEPPAELPEFLSRALTLISDEVSVSELAALQGLSAADIEALVRGEMLEDSSDAGGLEPIQGELFGRHPVAPNNENHRTDSLDG